jgi:hypothetical protein
MDFSTYEPHLSALRSMLKKILADKNYNYAYTDILDMNEARREYSLIDPPNESVALIVFAYTSKSKESNEWKPHTESIFLNSDKTFIGKRLDTDITIMLLDWLNTIH